MGVQKTVMQAARDIIKGLKNFDSENTVIMNWKVLDAGVRRAVIIEPMPFTTGPQEQGAFMAPMGSHASVRQYAIQVLRKYDADEDSLLDLVDDADDIIGEFNKYETLNGAANVENAYINGAGDILALMTEGEGPYFILQPLTLMVELSISRTSSE